MTSKPVGRSTGSGRPPAHRSQQPSILRPSTVILVGALVMAVSGFVFLFGPNVSDPTFNSVLQRSRRTLQHTLEAGSTLGKQVLIKSESVESTEGRSTLNQAQEDPQAQLQGSSTSVDLTNVSQAQEQEQAKQEASEASVVEQHSSGGGTAGQESQKEEEKEKPSDNTKVENTGDNLSSQTSHNDEGRKDSSSAGTSSENGRKSTPNPLPPAKSPEEELYDRMPIRQLPISHEMDDEELLWRASFISLRDPNRRLGPRKIAFLFSFTSQIFFAPLWAKFFKGYEERFSVYLHGVESNIEKATLPHVFHRRFVPTEPASTGTGEPYPHMFAVDAARRLVANALLDMSNEWFILVCDLCIPLHSFEYFYEYFSTGPTRNYVPHQTPPWKNGMDRFIASCYEPLIASDQWRKGGPWFGLTRRMALNLVADIKFYDKFATCCLPTKRGGSQPCFPLEHYLATVLPVLGTTGTNYIQPEDVTNWSTVFEDWWSDPSAGRPFVYNSTVVSEKLIRTMRRCHLGNLCYLQGAHFDPTTLPVLMNMTFLLGY